jgi:hypothetical protein
MGNLVDGRRARIADDRISDTSDRSGSLDPIGQCGLDRGAGVQRAHHDERSDGRTCELRRDIGGNRRQAQHMDLERLPGCPNRFQIFPAEMPQTEVEALARDRMLDDVVVPLKLISDRGADEVGSVRVKAFPHHEIDMAKVHIAKVDRNLFALAALWAKLVYVIGHP